MRQEVRSIAIPTSNATAGDATPMRGLMNAAVYVHGTGTFSFKVQVKISGAEDSNDDWVDLTGAITAAGMYPIAASSGAPLAATHVRIYRTTLAAGTPKALISGFNAATE